MHGALIAAVCVFSATQFAGADVKIVSEMIKSNANIKKHIYAYTPEPIGFKGVPWQTSR